MSGSGGKKYIKESYNYWNDVQKSFSNQTRLKDKGIHVVSTVTKQTDILLCSAEEFQQGTHVKYQNPKMGIKSCGR